MESLSLIVEGLTARRLSDEAVATAALGGNAGAFGELYRRYRRRVAGLCASRLGDSERAEDATQETFVRVLRAAPQVVENAEAWLFTIAGNVCKDMQRRASNAEIPTDAPEPGAELPTPDSASELMRREMARVVFLALRRLPTRSRTALMLREFHGMSSAEIAESMGISKSAVDPLVSRARDAFGAAYAEVGAFPERCRRNVERIYRDLGTGLEPGERAELDAHVESCSRCRTEYQRAHSPRYQRALIPFLIPGIPGAGFGVFSRALHTAASSPGVLRGLPVGRLVATGVLGVVLLAPVAVDYRVGPKISVSEAVALPLAEASPRAFSPAARTSGIGHDARHAVTSGARDTTCVDGASAGLCDSDYRAHATDHSAGGAPAHDGSGHTTTTMHAADHSTSPGPTAGGHTADSSTGGTGIHDGTHASTESGTTH